MSKTVKIKDLKVGDVYRYSYSEHAVWLVTEKIGDGMKSENIGFPYDRRSNNIFFGPQLMCNVQLLESDEELKFSGARLPKEVK